ncbi:hypothetical protein A3H89_04740 [Candidatus Amesbacteria bacterium RIFCSPLOWO2_02_FULL_48_11]|uniref:Uncharacterized protein n=4 Tax=Candidatus Amesiibacteriota TaxID=1752730 RepID=A0A1F4Z675_9BACT|nr:MAG: hypothetical protein UX78_C0011G0023 [Candidatus Amesbacteria bacterium GW2011_GWA2_47_11]KKU92958.1 MAG: hypothetical protein UY22_C0023G0010 [Candidatus Amesbacteria bacterium GW2011_GWC1_48_10]KKU99162.1 MAG: hypothetical protein UY33_C0036G0022 [Candidatus Amesbacteria bacterium GW2011_GWA1_48_9]OGC90710.1 MAG: hypothetical protein A2V48_03235 [Candidatus Amesbacteria bacterium RBG_19FT_COMBO_48_16]OGC97169.1 MAG: hypothetical protein A3C34_04180 [Candidatus Amesbacteria bacterium R
MPKKTLEQLGEARQDFYRKIGRGGPNVPAEVVIAVVGEVAAKKILEDGLNGDDLGFLANLLRSARVAGQPEWSETCLALSQVGLLGVARSAFLRQQP